jgi:hypothetical protein
MMRCQENSEWKERGRQRALDLFLALGVAVEVEVALSGKERRLLSTRR